MWRGKEEEMVDKEREEEKVKNLADRKVGAILKRAHEILSIAS